MEYLALLYREALHLSMDEFDKSSELESFQFWLAIRGFREQAETDSTRR